MPEFETNSILHWPGQLYSQFSQFSRPQGPTVSLNALPFQIQDHAVGDLHDVDPQGRFGGSVYNGDPIAVNLEYAQGSEILEDAHHEANAEIVDILQQYDRVATRPEQARKSARKRDRDRNWTEEETWVLVECKRLAFHDKASPFRKQKSSATNWEAISKELRTNPDTRASEKTGDQCRLRWDTLVKSHRIIKAWCMETEKEYAELTEEEISDLKLATTLNKEWYEVIDTISLKARSQNRDSPSLSVGDYGNLDARIENGPLPVIARIAPTDPGSHPLLAEGAPPVSTRCYSPGSPPAQMSTGRPEPGNSSSKQIAIPGFSSLDGTLRSTLLDLILGRGFLRKRWCLDQMLSLSCGWLSIVQNRSCSEIYNDVSMLVKMELVHMSGSRRDLSIDGSRFRMLDKFVKKVILNNPVYDTHKHFKFLDDINFIAADKISIPQRIRVLRLERCPGLERVDLRGLRKLRSLLIYGCEELVEVTGWKFLRELGWLEIGCCRSYWDYPDLRNLPSLREFRSDRAHVSDCPPRHALDISQCVRLRRLKIWHDDQLEESGDLSSLKCLEFLDLAFCRALSTIAGFSGLHSLTYIHFGGCKALRSLPDMGHMKELVCIDVSWSSLEEIPGVEKLVSLKMLDCRGSKLKHLPGLHHLPGLQRVWLDDTPLIEDDPSSFYFDKREVLYNCEETGRVDVSDISDTEYNLSGSSDDED